MQNKNDRTSLAALYAKVVAMFRVAPPAQASRYVLRSTSGTTGRGPLHIVYRIADSVLSHHDDSQRLVVCAVPRNSRLFNLLLVRYGSTKDQNVMFLDPKDTREDSTAILEDFAPDGLYGGVSFVASVASKLNSQALRKVRKLLVMGEYVTPTLRDFFARQFPRTALTQLYGTTETGPISMPPCGHLPLNSYHVIPEIEITLDAPEENGVGAVESSWNIVPGVRAERYASGDTGSLSNVPCACGQKLTLAIMGRSGFDYIKLAGAHLHRAEFDRVAFLCKDLFDEYRAEAYVAQEAGALRGVIVLSVYRKKGALQEEEKNRLRERFSTELSVAPTQHLADLVRQDAFLPLVVESVEDPFPEQNKRIPLRLRG